MSPENPEALEAAIEELACWLFVQFGVGDVTDWERMNDERRDQYCWFAARTVREVKRLNLVDREASRVP